MSLVATIPPVKGRDSRFRLCSWQADRIGAGDAAPPGILAPAPFVAARPCTVVARARPDLPTAGEWRGSTTRVWLALPAHGVAAPGTHLAGGHPWPEPRARAKAEPMPRLHLAGRARAKRTTPRSGRDPRVGVAGWHAPPLEHASGQGPRPPQGPRLGPRPPPRSGVVPVPLGPHAPRHRQGPHPRAPRLARAAAGGCAPAPPRAGAARTTGEAAGPPARTATGRLRARAGRGAAAHVTMACVPGATRPSA